MRPSADADPAAARFRRWGCADLVSDLHAARGRLPRVFRWHLGCAALAGSTAALLFLGAGYHAGFNSIQGLSRLLPDTLWQIVTYLGDTAVALFVLLAIARRQPGALWAGTIAALLGTIAVNLLKHRVGALRPPAVLDAEVLTVIGRAYHNGSFPSGHAVTAFALALTLLPPCRGAVTRAALLFAAGAVAMSRVVVGVHWPVDVLAGAALGAALSWVSWQIARRWPMGLTLAGHLALLGAVALAAGFALFDPPDYPAARTLHLLLGALAFGAAAGQYLWPRWRGGPPSGPS
jgi:membrane-associated phospholipid phosphatase